MPRLHSASPQLGGKQVCAGLTAHARLNADFDYAMLRRASLSGDGMMSWQSGRYAFTASSCDGWLKYMK